MKMAVIFLVILAVQMQGHCAFAQLSRQTVSRAWQKITRADGFASVPIHYKSDEDPNAWVQWQDSENFNIHVTEGLMRILNTESEIAEVLGHEIGHVQLGHYHNIVLADTARTIMTANSEHSHELAQAVGNIGLELRESSFSREQETDADDYGVALLKKAGYNSLGLYNAMKRMDSAGYATEHSGFNSHPSSRERLAHLAEISGDRNFGRNHAENNSSGDVVDDIAAAMMGR